MKTRDKNPVLKGLIESLEKASEEQKVNVWKAVAKSLNRPRRKAHEIPLKTIERTAKPGETVIVPGTVLSTGELKKKLTVAALRFSGPAREKITKAGGNPLTLEDVIKENPKGKHVRIMG